MHTQPLVRDYQTGWLDELRYQQTLVELGARLDALWETDPIPYRHRTAVTTTSRAS